jgi:DNA-binding NtrC family response regulator
MAVNTIRLIMADDDEMAQLLLKKGIEVPGIEILTASSGQEALTLLEQGPCDILLSDVSMPKPTGLELTKIVREKYPNTDVIILTGYTTMEMVFKALDAGAYDFLTKPFDLNLVRAALRRCLEKRALQSQLGGESLVPALRDLSVRVKELKDAVEAVEFGPEHESCRTFAQKLLNEIDTRLAALGANP